jgi:ribosome-binding protein aMBF1 (putative translation factor)
VILCLTPANLHSRWIHFEAGAVSRLDQGRVSALLLEVSPTQIEFPLQQFQHTRLTKRDVWQLVRDLNGLCRTPLDEARLRKSFDRQYPDVEAELEKLRKTLAQEQEGQAEPARTTESILSDMLAVQQGLASKLQTIQARIRGLESPRLPSVLSSGRRARRIANSTRRYMIDQRVGRRLREIRHARGWSLDMLASKSGVDRDYIARIEWGIRSPSISLLCRLSQALRVLPGDLINDLSGHAGPRAPKARNGKQSVVLQ